MAQQLPRIYENPMGIRTQGGSGGGYSINVSPTFSDIGNPNVNVAGRDMSIGGPGTDIFGGPGNDRINTNIGGVNPPEAPRTPTGQPNTPTSTNRPQTPRPQTPKPQTIREQPKSEGEGKSGTDGKKGYGLKDAVKSGQTKNPRITKSELESILSQKGATPREIKQQLQKKGYTLGGKALDFLNKQLEEAGRKPYRPSSSTSSTRTSSSNNQTTGFGGATLRSSGLQLLYSGSPNNANLGKTGRAVQAAAGTKGSPNKLTRSEVSSLLKSGDVSANKILKQVEKGNIDAGKKAIAKAKAAKKKGK